MPTTNLYFISGTMAIPSEEIKQSLSFYLAGDRSRNGFRGQTEE